MTKAVSMAAVITTSRAPNLCTKAGMAKTDSTMPSGCMAEL